ncbi:MAG: hypothetical protein ACP5I8_14640, partial [Phycisphaerae bacterium]
AAVGGRGSGWGRAVVVFCELSLAMAQTICVPVTLSRDVETYYRSVQPWAARQHTMDSTSTF